MNEQIQIKEATISHLSNNEKTIKKLMADSMIKSFLNDTIDEDMIKNRYDKMMNYVQKETGIVLIAEENDRLLGYLWYFIMENNRIHINQIVTHKKNRGQGIGTKLIERLYQEAINNKVSAIELNVTKSNEKAMDFYKKEKFEVERILLKRDINV